MKKILPFIIVAIITGGIGFFIGQIVAQQAEERYQKFRPIFEIKADLKAKEIPLISSQLKGSARIETRNEGSLFKSKYQKYFVGTIQNNALIAKAKDVKVRVTFLSKTKSEIGNVEYTIYEIIEPGKSKSFEKKIDVSEDVAEFNWNILSAEAE